LRHAVQYDLAARREEGEAFLDLTLQRLATDSRHRTKPLIESELSTLVSDII